jgi:protein gp37
VQAVHAEARKLVPNGPLLRWPLPNVWLGVSVEDQERADERIPLLLETPAAVRFLSCEPLLGPVDLTRVRHHDTERFSWLTYDPCVNVLTGNYPLEERVYKGDVHPFRLHWVIAGGESGPNARPMHPDWARGLRDQCAAAGVPFFFKQWGEYGPCITEETEDGPITYLNIPRDGFPRQSIISKGARPEVLEFIRGGWSVGGWWQSEAPEGVLRVGKHAAGRLLDGREHNEFPAGPT